MPERLNLVTKVTPETDADRLLEAILPIPEAHREGGAKRAEDLIAANPTLTGANIWVAAATGDIDAARAFLEKDPSLASKDGGTRNWDPLLYLSFSRLLRTDPDRAKRMVEIARLLLDAGADPNTYWIDPAEGEGNRETPTYGAAGIANNVELARLLIERGADPNDGETAYHMVEHTGVPCAEIIFPKLDEKNRMFALAHLIDYDDYEGLKKLLELGADPNGPTPFNGWPIHQAVFRVRDKKFFDLLIEYDADINKKNKEGRTPYAIAARAGHADVMKWVADAGGDTTLAPPDAYIAACAAGDKAGAEKILKSHPDIIANFTDRDRSEINEAAGTGRTEGVRTMLEMGWDVNNRGIVWGETPAHRAALEGRLDTFKFLVSSGADLTICDRQYHCTPLSWAFHGEKPNVVTYIRTLGNQLDAWDAIELGLQDRLAELLPTIDVNEGLRNCEPGVLLRLAAAHGNPKIAAALLDAGADPSLLSGQNMTPLDVAREKGHTEIVRLLESWNRPA